MIWTLCTSTDHKGRCLRLWVLVLTTRGDDLDSRYYYLRLGEMIGSLGTRTDILEGLVGGPGIHYY